MKKTFFMACTALVVSAAAVVGVKAYNYYSMSPLMRANLEALSKNESPENTVFGRCEKNPNEFCIVACPYCNGVWYSQKPGPIKYAYGTCTYPNCNKYFDTRNL